MVLVLTRSNVQAEEAKLISQLAGMDVINGELFKQAYDISLDASEFLDRYEMYKLLKGPYDKEGACIIVTAGGCCFRGQLIVVTSDRSNIDQSLMLVE